MENRRLSSTDAAGNTTSYAYDNVGRLTKTTFADGSSTSTTYDAAGQAVKSVDELGQATLTAYDADGRQVSTKDATGAITQTRYDAVGNATTTTDPLGHATQVSYDADNRPVITTYADGSADASVYDASGRMTAKIDPLGRTTTFAYDALGRLTSVTDALGKITQYAYDEVGNRVRQTDANGQVTSFAYDSRSREIRRTLPDSSAEAKAYDGAGQLTTRTDFNGAVTGYTYDLLGRLVSRSYPDASSASFTYTPDGRRATAVDSRGTTAYAYDSRRRLVQETYPDGRMLSFGYDANGNRTTLTATIGGAALTTLTTYDADNRPAAVTDPLGRSFALSYDAAGNRTGLQYPNTTGTAYTYDLANRLTSLATTQGPAPSPASVQSYAYALDAAGKRTGITESGGTARNYAYDGVDRLTGETVTGALSYAKVFAYDPVGNRLKQTTTGAGVATVNYAYDTRDRLTTENATGYAYDANGNLTSKTGEASYTWDYENRLTHVETAAGTTVANVYDVDGNRVQTSLTPLGAGAPVRCAGNTATYQDLDTLAQGNWIGLYGADGYYMDCEAPAPPPYGAVTFAGTKDLFWSGSTSDVRALEQPPPQTSRIACAYYSFGTDTFHVATTDGNAHSVALYMFDWDHYGPRDQTITALTPSGTVLDPARPSGNFGNGQYAVYNICGNVDFTVTNTVPGVTSAISGIFFDSRLPPTTTNYLVDTSGGLSQDVADTDGNGTLTAYNVRVGDELLAVMRPGASVGTWSTRFVHSDGLGSVRVLTDETGATIDQRGYEAFGTKNVEAGSDPLAYGFAGEPFEPTSKLAYHRARWMDSRVGRFEGMDPEPGRSRYPLSRHRYLYALVNPVNVTDSSGSEPDIASETATVDIVGIEATTSVPSEVATSEAIVAGADTAEVTGAFIEEVETVGTELVEGSSEVASETSTQLARQLGSEGESVAGIVKNTTRIPSATGRAAYRIPDVLNQGLKIIGDVKNVRYLAYGSQLQDFAAFAEANGYTFQLIIRVTTVLSASLQAAEKAGLIDVIRVLP